MRVNRHSLTELLFKKELKEKKNNKLKNNGNHP